MSFLRDAALLAMGEKKFTRNGFYEHAKSFDPHALDVSLDGRVYIATGGSSGICRSTIEYLVSQGAKVHLLLKDMGRADILRSEILSKSGRAQSNLVSVHVIDLSEPAKIHEFCQQFLSSGERLDGLIHGASVNFPQRINNSDGIDLTVAVNLLAPFVLTNNLIPILQKSSPSRVIFVSSPTVFTTKVHPDKISPDCIEKYDGEQIFAETKRGLIILAERMSSFYATSGVKFFSMHPGWINSPDAVEYYKIDVAKLRSEEEGSDTLKWLCVSPIVMLDDSKYNGSFFFDRDISRKHMPAALTTNSEEDVNRMWEMLSRYGKWTLPVSAPAPPTQQMMYQPALHDHGKTTYQAFMDEQKQKAVNFGHQDQTMIQNPINSVAHGNATAGFCGVGCTQPNFGAPSVLKHEVQFQQTSMRQPPSTHTPQQPYQIHRPSPQ